MLEPSTAARFFDTCLMSEIDLSAVCWICTANTLDGMSAPLRSRLEIVHVPRPDPDHFDVIVTGLMLGLASHWQVPVEAMPVLPRRAAAMSKDGFARRRSIRLLKRQLEAVVAAVVPDRRGLRELN